MTNAMPDRRMPIKNEDGVEIGEVTGAEFDVETQVIRFSGKLDSTMNFTASQPLQLVPARKKECGCYGGPHGGYTDPECR